MDSKKLNSMETNYSYRTRDNGNHCLTDSRFKGMNVTRGIAVIRYDEKKIDPIYLNEYLKMEESQQYIKEAYKGSDFTANKFIRPS